MKVISKLTALAVLSVFILAGCGTATFGDFNLIGSAKDAKESTIGKNDRMVYIASGTVDEVCDEQAKLISDAGWETTEEPRRETTYKTSSYSKDSANVTLMCSEQEDASIKVTLTLQKGA